MSLLDGKRDPRWKRISGGLWVALNKAGNLLIATEEPSVEVEFAALVEVERADIAALRAFIVCHDGDAVPA